MNGKTLALGALTTTLLLSGCVTDTRVAGPARPRTVVAAPPPPPPPVVVASPAVYAPEPNDVYLSAALDSDVVYVNGSTYVWYVGRDGRRHRHWYGHGDLRSQVMHRRSQLRLVSAHRDGHPPMQAMHMAPPRARVVTQPQRRPQDHAQFQTHALPRAPQRNEPRHQHPQPQRQQARASQPNHHGDADRHH